jgi:hypothetical protein
LALWPGAPVGRVMSGRMAACIPRAAGFGRSDCHAENLVSCARCHLRRCDGRVFHHPVDTEAGCGVVVSSRLGLASRMALWLARLLLGSTARRRSCPASRCRSASGRLCAAARCSRSRLGPGALEWSVLGSRTLGVMHYVSQPQRARLRICRAATVLAAPLGNSMLRPAQARDAIGPAPAIREYPSSRIGNVD